MQWHIALHMHGDITLNGHECMVDESTLLLVFDWVDSVKWDNVRLNKVVKKICVGY